MSEFDWTVAKVLLAFGWFGLAAVLMDRFGQPAGILIAAAVPLVLVGLFFTVIWLRGDPQPEPPVRE